MRKLNCGEPKPTQMTINLVDRFITYPYRIIEDDLVRVNRLLFLANFVIFDMSADSGTLLLLERPFLATSKYLINVEMGQLILRFNKEHVIFKVFEVTKHNKENLQCYKVDVVEDVVEEVSPSESPLLLIKLIMVNSIDTIEEG